MTKSWFRSLQRVGKALMVPVAVLPAAGLLLGLGTSPLGIFPEVVQSLLLQTGSVIFSLLPLLFAMAIALSFCHQDGSASVSAVIGYGVMLATMSVLAQVYGWETSTVLGMSTLNTGALGGVLSGAVTSMVYRRCYRAELPEFLGFFAGRRLVPLANVPAAILLGLLMASLWPWMTLLLDKVSHWVVYQQPMLAWGVYGLVERLLIPLGLHHIWNLPFYYEVGSFSTPAGYLIQGEVGRFLAGDPDAGHLAGGYLVKVWGLPAAALAIWRCADVNQRTQTAGVMFSAGLTCAITGVTEPVEFVFLFVAPLLYLVHALLTGLAYVLAIAVDFHHGLVFSQGLLDFSLFYHLSRNDIWFWVLGILYGVAYYFLFSFVITRFNLPTPGRTPHEAKEEISAEEVLSALGGGDNIRDLDACLTRLRVSVHQAAMVKEPQLKQLGAKGVVVIGDGVQVVFGPQAEKLRGEMQELLLRA
ncbi:PTS transporter subunit EIIC [Ferrimonas sp. YFM]|uniref:PTS transporter subunit EIIC n=1 Tax=Ferrimonas sp. YFM TaxID=3028878 RepID=UPI002572E13A|nr:PTS transporter subunit EIIC [Ferrimonas sp. YFM]BDY06228.1 PTS glucose transporter subunit IIB [Ferrimonas sp. YFM]